MNLSQQATSTVNGAFQFQTGNITWTGFIDALKQENLVKVLAKPTLVALNGQEAAFLAGGEFPIPVPQAFGFVTIQFKKFGVGLVFTPNILDKKHISFTVAPEVSELDFQNALRLKDSSFRRSRRDEPRRRSSWPTGRALRSVGSCGTT